MTPFFAFRLSRFLLIEAGNFGLYASLGMLGLHVCRDARFEGERWAWIKRDGSCTTGRFGPLTFTINWSKMVEARD